VGFVTLGVRLIFGADGEIWRIWPNQGTIVVIIVPEQRMTAQGVPGGDKVAQAVQVLLGADGTMIRTKSNGQRSSKTEEDCYSC
jgi:hypothetical protein